MPDTPRSGSPRSRRAPRRIERLTDWHFHLGDVRYGGREFLDHSDWRQVTVPHDWSVEHAASPARASCTGYLPGGIAWYRTDLQVPATSAGKRLYLYFGGVYNNSEVFVNGKWLGKRPNGYVSFMVDLTPYIKPGGRNVVAVRVDHSREADSRWYTGSGIYRDVHLITAEPVHIGLWGVYCTAAVSGDRAELNIETTLENHEAGPAQAEIAHELVGPAGAVVATCSQALSVTDQATSRQQMTVADPQLWALEEPHLYELRTTVLRGGQVSDRSTVRVGIRTLTFDPDRGFALNGKWLKIKGVCLHHDAGVLGAAVPKQVWSDRILRLKEIGCNGIRMSHNPQATDLYDLCDELGMLVMDEAFDEWEYPKKKWLEGWNVGVPGFQGSADYFRTWGKRDLESMVRRDRNHASIIMWSIGNEVDYPNDPYSHPILNEAGIGQQHVAGYQESQPHADRLGDIAKELAAVVRGLDTSRPVTAALAGAVMSNETDYPGALDVVGYNYTEDRYRTDHEKYPERVLYGSETRHDLPAWKAVTDNAFIFGQFIWTGFDYLGESGRWPSRGFTTGMIDLANNIKPQGYFRRALWADEPVAYLGTESPRKERPSMHAGRCWNYAESESVRVVCYTNADAAELLLNGESIGERKPCDDETGIIHWDVQFRPGELTVVAFRDGADVARDRITTSGRPHAVRAACTSGELRARHDVVSVALEVVDEAGELVWLADSQVTCQVAGPARLLGLENASANAADVYTGNTLRCKNGRLLAYIQATADAGTVDVTFAAPLLVPARIGITIGTGAA